MDPRRRRRDRGRGLGCARCLGRGTTSAMVFDTWKLELLKSPTTLSFSGGSGGNCVRHAGGFAFGRHGCCVAMAAIAESPEHK